MKCSDDDNLIRFVKEYEPCPAPAAKDHEAALMTIIDAQTGQRKSKRSPKVIWLFPTAIAAGLVVMLGQYRPQKPAVLLPQVAENVATPLVMTGNPDDQELGAFLEESWSNSLGENATKENFTYGYASYVSNPAP